MYLLDTATAVSMTKQICDYLKRKCRNVKLDKHWTLIVDIVE